MLRILVPVDGSTNSLHAVRYVIGEFRKVQTLALHLLNVQAPFSSYVARFVDRAERQAFHLERGNQALQPACKLLDHFGVPFHPHVEVGNKACVIAEFASHLRCDHIVMSTARKNSLVRLVENSTAAKVLERATVPVIVIAGETASGIERYGVPAGVGTALASLLFAAAE